MSWERRSGRTVYENPWIRVHEDAVRRPDGGEGIYGVLELRNPAVFVVALTEADEVLMVHLDRYTVGDSWEIPGGGSDGDDPLEAAQRELLEETGMTASSWRLIGRMNALKGVCRAAEYVYLATGLTQAQDATASQASEGITQMTALPWAQLMDWVRSGRIGDGETVAAPMYAALELRRL